MDFLSEYLANNQRPKSYLRDVNIKLGNLTNRFNKSPFIESGL